MRQHKNRWLVTAAIFLISIVQTLLQYACSSFLTVMVEELAMTGAQQGTFTGIQSLVSMFYLLIGTMIAIKLGTKKTYAVGSALALVSGFCFYLGTYPSIVAARVVLGVAQGMTLPLASAAFNLVFGENKKGATLATGIYSAGFYAGRYISLAITYPLLNLVGSWKVVFLILGSVSIFGTALWWFAFPGSEEYQGRGRKSSALQETFASWKAAWKNNTVKKFLAYFAFSGISGTVFGAYSVALLVKRLGLEAAVASGIAAYTGIGGLIGSLAGGYVASRFKVKAVIVPAQICSGICMILVSTLGSPSVLLLSVIMFVYGFCSGAHSTNNMSLMYKQRELTTNDIIGGMSLIMFMQKFAGYLSPRVFGPVYTNIGIGTAMMIWAIPVFIGGAIVTTIKEPSIKEMDKEAQKA